MNITPIIKSILEITLPFIYSLIQSKFVPAIKRKGYEKLDDYADKIIEDLAQNASKIKKETNETKRLAYCEGTQLGIEMLRALADKFNKAADEISKEL